MPVPQLQWELARTSDSTLSVTKGIIRASTSDNIQILTLLACERFGATLAICPETCRKVESLVIKLQTPTTRVITFLSAKVGYSPGDCASQLAQSLAGIQFIALAAALVPSYSPFKGAVALEAMLRSSARDKTLLPPARHLKDLLMSLEHRCVQMGFGDLLLGWCQILHHQSELFSARISLVGSNYVPDLDGLRKLVEALGQLSRIGNASSLKLKATGCIPWVAAFIQWCIGLAPSIYSENGRSIIEQPTSRITLIANSNSRTTSGLEIAIQDSLGSPADLISTGEIQQRGSRMVTIERYGQWLLQYLDLDTGIPHRAAIQALPYCLKQVIRFLRISRIREFDRSEMGTREWGTHRQSDPRFIEEKEILGAVPCPFPKDSVISAMLSRMLGSSQKIELLSLKDGLLITDLPLVESYINDLRRKCTCTPCSYSDHSSKCERDHGASFFNAISPIIAHILALSLFDFPEALLIHLRGQRSAVTTLDNAVISIFEQGRSEPVICPAGEILQLALSLVGHDVEDDFRFNQWVISSFKGQVVYPKIFETQCLEKRGYLMISWAPGLLQYDGESYSRGVSETLSTLMPDTLSHHGSETVNIPRNLVPDQKLVWQVSRGDNILHVNMGIQDTINGLRHISKTPFRVLLNLAHSFMLETCPHPSDSPLAKTYPWLQYTGPLNPYCIEESDSKNDPHMISVAAVEGNDGLRMLCLTHSHPAPFVIRRDACLTCCIDICQRTGYPLIIC